MDHNAMSMRRSMIPSRLPIPNINPPLPALSNCSYFDDYSTYTLTDLTNPPSSLIPLSGQINPAGFTITGSNFFGAADANVLTSVGATPPSGTPAHGKATPFFALAARGSVNTGYNSGIGVMGNYQHQLFIPTSTQPIVVSQDIYLDAPDGQPRTSGWWSPVEFGTNSIYDRVFFGGQNLQGALGGFSNPQGATDRFLSLGKLPGGGDVFFANAPTSGFPFPVNEWFTLMAHVSVSAPLSGYSLWLKTPETAVANTPFIDPRMASGDITPIDADPVGWVNLYPGNPDDFFTVLVREGIGLARDNLGNTAPRTGQFLQAPLFDQPNFDGVQYGWGFDDPFNPLFQPNNYFFGNYCVLGSFIIPPNCPADLSGDNTVSSADLAILLGGWGGLGAFTPSDLDSSGVVDSADLAIMLSAWGPC